MVENFHFALELCDEIGVSDPWPREKNKDQVWQDPTEFTKETSVFF